MFVAKGYNVAFNCVNNGEKMNSHVNSLVEKGFSAKAYVCDVSNFKDVEKMINSIYENFNGIDILVNNAGISYVGLFTEMKEKEWLDLVNTNILGVFNCSKFAAKKMVSEKSGVIINISSIWGEVGASCEVVYSATKGALNSFTKALAKELGPSGIRVNGSFMRID